MATQNPLTVEQLRQMQRDLVEMKMRSDEMSALLCAGFGADDQRTFRAQELSSAILRLQWAIERGGRRRSGGVGGSVTGPSCYLLGTTNH